MLQLQKHLILANNLLEARLKRIKTRNRTCMPRRAKITIKRKSRSNRDAIDCIEFNREATKFDSDFQYLNKSIGIFWLLSFLVYVFGQFSDKD